MNNEFKSGATLDTRVMCCCGSINYNNCDRSEDSIMNIRKTFIAMCDTIDRVIENYYFILHFDTDIVHIHYILELSNQVRLKSMLNHLESLLKVNRNAINIDKCVSVSNYLKYMLHLTDLSIDDGKEVYSSDDIYSNLCDDIVQNYIDCDDNGLSIERLIDICFTSKDLIEIMRKLGLKTYHKYRYEIKDILDREYYLQNTRKFKNRNIPF